MSVYKRPDSKYYQYDFTVPAVGRRRGSTRQKKLNCAVKFEAQLIAQAMEGNAPVPRRSVLLSELWSKFEKSPEFTKLDPDSQRYYRNGWRMLEAPPNRIAKMRVASISLDDVNGLVIPGSPSNVNNALRTLRRLMTVAERMRAIAKRTSVPLLEERERVFLLDETTENLLMPHSAPLLKDIIKLTRDLGTRPARELYPLRIENIDFNNRLVVIPDSKTKSGHRIIPLTNRALDILLVRCGERREGWVFPSVRKGKHVTPGLVNKLWVRARKAAGLPSECVLYCGRHDTGTYLMEKTGDIKSVMAMLGQKDIKSALRYTRVRIDRIRDILNMRSNKEKPQPYTN